jgi:UDP-2,3-diacylglucosamine pyrophosphatase LpxH
MIFLTEKYAKLNIDFYNFDKLTKDKDKFTDILNKTKYIKNKEEIIDILNNEELTVYYENNIKRDTVFFNSVKDLSKENTVNILVIGGFHKNLLTLFNDNKKKYVIIFPNTNGNDNKIYKQLILDIGNYNSR